MQNGVGTIKYASEFFETGNLNSDVFIIKHEKKEIIEWKLLVEFPFFFLYYIIFFILYLCMFFRL